MLIFFVVLILICLYKIRFSNFHEDYMDKNQAGSIKGIFAIIIFFSHFRSYVQLSNGFLDKTFLWVINLFGQLMVTLFFFYSGYGILKSYKKKEDYKKGFFKKRILKTLIHFDIIVLIYVVLALILKSDYSWKDYVLAFTGWASVGNSNWFIFVILALYVITLLAFFIAKRTRPILATCLVCVFSCVLFLGLYFAKKESWWLDTLFCYSAGMIFACLEDKINLVIKKSKIYNYGLIIGIFICFCVSYIFTARYLPYVVAGNITAVLFCLCVVLILTKIKMDNVVLRWLGKYSFYIYICQRIPMIILYEIGISNSIIFFLISIILTMAISVFFNFVFEKFDNNFLLREKDKSKI